MAQYKNPINPGTSAIGAIYTFAHVVDVDLTNKVAHLIDQLGNPLKASVTRSFGKQFAYPSRGEDWILTRQFGDWVFAVNVSPSLASGLVQTGSVLQWAGTLAPAGFLFCDGSAVSRVNFPTLFTVIGTRFGTGDGTTTFNLPNIPATPQAINSIIRT